MKVHVCCPQDLLPPEEQPGCAGDPFPSVPLCLGQTGAPLELGEGEGAGISCCGVQPHPAALSSPYLSCPVNAAQISRKQGDPHSGIYWCDHLDLDFVRSSLSPASSGEQELGSPLVIRAGMNSACPVSSQDLNFSAFGVFGF